MAMRYLGGINSPPYNSLAANVTTGVATTQQGGVYTTTSVAQAAGVQQWVNDPYFKNTVTLYQADNAVNGSQNNTFLDSGTANGGIGWTVTRNGNTTQGSFSPFSAPNGYWSGFFDGTGDYLVVTGSSNLAFGTSDFSIECWVYMTAFNASASVIYDTRPAGTVSGAYPRIQILTASRRFEYLVGTTSAILSNTTTVITTDRWFHVAVSRVSGTTRMFINGVAQTATYTDANNYLNGASRPVIGTEGNSIGNDAWDGYISNFRIINGSGFTSVTVPTSPLTAITNTQLLTCQSNRFIDNSSNNYTVTKFNQSQASSFTPFFNPTPYSVAVTGGAAFLDGTGDYLSIPDNAALELGSNSFCFECLFFTTTIATTGSILQKRTGTNVFPILIWRNGSNLQVYMSASSNGDIVGGGSGALLGVVYINQWNHVSVYRIGTAIYGSLNGVITTLNANTSQTVLNNGTPYTIGMNGDGTSDPFNGYISNARLVIGSGVYTSTSAPVPTAPLTNIANTKFLLNTSNTNVFDATAKVTAETVGNAQITTSVKKYGSGSMFFDGTGDWLLNRHTPDLDFGTGDFTVECWLNMANTTVARSLIGKGAAATGWGIYFNAAPTLFIFEYGGAVTYSSNYNLNQGEWYHLAVTRSGGGTNNLKMFINGFLVHEATVTGDLSTGANMYVGASRTGTQPMFGYIDDLRLTRGVARYTSQFIPPAIAMQRQG